MSNYSKWVGGAIGWALGGPIGGLLGFQVGKMFAGFAKNSDIPQSYARNTQRGDFSISLVILSAAVMKADGKIMKSELDYVKKFMKMNFGTEQAEQLLLILRKVLKENIDYRQVASQVRFNMDHPKRMLLLQYLYGISNADGEVHPHELDIIRFIAKYLGISDKDRLSIEQAFHTVSDPYKVLEIDRSCTDSEVKKAYRKLAIKFHPDKIGDLGDGPKKKAEERFLQIQDAYEKIKKTRGFK